MTQNKRMVMYVLLSLYVGILLGIAIIKIESRIRNSKESKRPQSEISRIVQEPSYQTESIQSWGINTENDEVYVEKYGILRTTGLTQQDKNEEGLTYSNYMVEKPVVRDGFQGEYDYSFIESPNIDKSLIGKCVLIKGYSTLVDPNAQSSVYSIYMGVNKMYGNSKKKIELMLSPSPTDNCPILDRTNRSIPDARVITKFTIGIARSIRLSYDIGYDYETIGISQEMRNNPLFLDSEFEKVFLIPQTSEVAQIFERNINKRLTLTGYYENGYAESTDFTVIEAAPPK